MIKKDENLYHFTDKTLKAACNIAVENYHDKNVNSTLTIAPKYEIIGIAEYHIDKIVIELAKIYATLVNQYKFIYQLSFLAFCNKYGEEEEITSQIELPNILTFTENLTQSDLNKIDIQWALENRIQKIEMKESGWNYQMINSMSIKFYETGILKGSSYVKIPLRSCALLNIEDNDKYCFLWSILAKLYPISGSKSGHAKRVSSYKQYFNKLNIEVSDFTVGFKCSDMQKFEKLNTLSINIFGKNFHLDINKWKHILIPIELSKNRTDKVIDLIIYKNHFALIRKLKVFLGKQDCRYSCRKCLSRYRSDNMIIKHIQKCGMRHDITTIKTSNRPYINWKKHYHKNPVYFRIFADFEADNEIDDTYIGNKTINIYKQNSVCN